MNKSQYDIAKAMPKDLRTYVYGYNLFSSLVNCCKMPKGTYGPMLGLMVSDGMVITKSCNKSGRNKYYSITAKGKKAIAKYERKQT